MVANPPFISFIIATINRPNCIKQIISSITTQSHPPPSENTPTHAFEIIIVDQTPPKNNDTKMICNTIDSVQYIHSDTLGLSFNRNLGAQHATGQVLVFLDDDCTLGQHYIQNLTQFMASNASIDGMAGFIINHGSKTPYSRYQAIKTKELSMNDYNCFMGGHIIFKPSFFKKINGFDPQFGAGKHLGGSEDSDIFLRSILANGKIWFSTDINVTHPEANFSTESISAIRKKSYDYGLGRGALLRKLFWKNPTWVFGQLITNLAKPCAGLLAMILTVNIKGVTRFTMSFIGRIIGFVTYQRF